VAAKPSPFALNSPAWLPGKLQLEKHIVQFGEQNRLKQPVFLPSLMGSCPWQHDAGWGWDGEDVKRRNLSFPFLKGLEQTGPFLSTGSFWA